MKLLFILLLMNQNSSAAEITTTESPIKAYSSSYHAFYVGNVVKNNNPSDIIGWSNGTVGNVLNATGFLNISYKYINQ